MGGEAACALCEFARVETNLDSLKHCLRIVVHRRISIEKENKSHALCNQVEVIITNSYKGGGLRWIHVEFEQSLMNVTHWDTAHFFYMLTSRPIL